jgi:hypothetical protein
MTQSLSGKAEVKLRFDLLPSAYFLGR